MNILLLKNVDKDLSDLKILITRDCSSLNHGPLNLSFRFTDSYIGHPNEKQVKIVLKYQLLIPILAIKHTFLKVTKKCNLIWMFEASLSIARKKPFQFLAKSVKNLFHWLIFFDVTNIKYLHLLMCLLHAKDYKVVANSQFGKFWS